MKRLVKIEDSQLNTENQFNLTENQKVMWLANQMNLEEGIYNEPVSIQIKGNLDQRRLQKALQYIVKQHAALQMNILSIKDKLKQVRKENVSVKMDYYDWSSYPSTARNEMLENSLKTNLHKRFDLASDTLFRFTLYRLESKEYLLHMIFYHIIYDGWGSLRLFLRDLERAYSLTSTVENESNIQGIQEYEKIIKRHENYIGTEAYVTSGEYWRTKLEGDLPWSQFPTSRVSPSVPKQQGDALQCTINPNLSKLVEQFSKKSRVSPYRVWLSVYVILLHQMTNQTELIIGMPINTRNRVGEEKNVFGYFVNTVPLRIKISTDETFSELVQKVNKSVEEAIAHGNYPLSHLVQELDMNREENKHSLYSTVFNMVKLPKIRMGGLETKVITHQKRISVFDMVWRLTQSLDEDLSLEIDFNSEIYDEYEIQNFTSRFQYLLQMLMDNNDIAICNLDLLLPQDYDVYQRNGTTDKNDILSKPLDQLIDEQANSYPDQIAIAMGQQNITYYELQNLSNQVAQTLLDEGFQKQNRVSIIMNRSIEAIVSMIGVLKAGGIYVPVDSDFPVDRIRFILEDSESTHIITSHEVGLWNFQSDQRVIIYEDIPVQCIADKVQRTHTIEDAAYIIYTSGSTGNPKGVLIPHKGVIHFIKSLKEMYHFQQQHVHIQFASLIFDASVWEIYGSLLTGGKLYILSETERKSTNDFIQMIQKQKVNFCLLPALFFRNLTQMSSEELEKLKTLNYIFVGGETLLPETVRKWQEKIGLETPVVNAYGPTEATVCVSTNPIINKITAQQTNISIGKPFPHTEIYILNQQQQLCPPNVPGEICIGGASLAQQYINQQDKTKAAFVTVDLPNFPKVRLYKSGDQGRITQDGQVEFLGRIDKQVKIRGYRIELEEIEEQLLQHPAIQHASVIVYQSKSDEQQLIAFYTLQKETSVDAEDIKNYLSKKLPYYMMPNYIQGVDNLPLTSSGKIDKKSLQKQACSMLENRKHVKVQPNTDSERKLQNIWAEVLRVNAKQISVQDDFFNIGGHSLLTVKVANRIQSIFQAKIRLKDLYVYRTIHDCAKYIEQLQFLSQRQNEDVLPPLKATVRNEYEQLSYAQQRLWFIDNMETDSSLYNIPLAWRLKGQYNIDSLTKAFNQLIQRHEILRTVFKEINGKPMQLIQDYQEHLLPVVDLRHLSQEEKNIEMERLAKIDADQPFNLRQGPLIRAYLLLMENDELVIHCTIHHIIFDGWSLNIFIDEWMNLYQAHLTNQVNDLSNLPIQYADFANWQRNILQGENLNKQLEYWKKELNGPIPVLQLPLDFPRPAIQTYNGSTHQFILPKTLLNKIKSFSRKESVTLFAVLLASYQGFLSRYTGQKEVLVGSPIANRHYPEIEGLIGLFVNTLIYRAHCTNNTTFKELVKQINGKIIEAQDHQDVPFEKIVEAVKPERNTSYSPLSQTMFALQNPSRGVPAVVDHQLEELSRSTNSSKFDLTVTMEEVAAGLKVEFEYNTDLFLASTIERMVQNFEIWLNEVVDFPEKPIGKLSLINKTEEKQLLQEWTNTIVEYPKECVIQELFEQQVVKSPNAVAVVYKDQQLTYKELNERANQLAHYLQKKSIGPEKLVGICVERSLEMIVGLLGILKAGAAYVPLDPAYPEERLKYIVKDSGIKIILTKNNTDWWISKDVQTISLEKEWEFISKGCNINPLLEVNPDNLAYVIYTSGSTGNPKGVLLEQKSLCNLVHTSKELMQFTSKSRVIQFASLSFDASVFNIFNSLVSGSELYLCCEEDIIPVEPLTTFLQKNKITHALLPPTVLNLLDESQLKDLQVVISGGSACSEQVAKRWSINKKFINAYGPTEATVYVTAGIYEGEGIQTIGRSIPNVEVYVLDQNLQLVPVGVAGELYIGGIALARGYLNRPELTAASFVSHPFNDDPNAKLYKTGDLVKYLPDGNIEYMERIDNQVKIRGFRIELGEIEAVLEQHPNIKEVVVMVQDDKLGDKQLIAYVVGEGEVQEWKNHIQAHLPGYMIPAYFVNIEAIPLTINGKVDKKSLPEWQHLIQNSKEYIPPRTDVERKLVAIWSEVLGISTSVIGVEDSFFELGGHSLKIMATLVKTLSEGWDIGIKDYYELKTISKIAEKINSESESASALNVSNIQFVTPPKKKMAKNKKCFDSKSGILLTGSTGYLGVHLLEKLLDTTQNRIYCVVRGENDQQANARLTKMLKFYFKDKFEKYEALVNKRVFVVKGELADKQFGLDNVRYEELKEQVNIVIHAAALTKHFGDWTDFENANVQSVKEILKFVGTDKQLHHISTTSVSGQYTSNEVNAFTENDSYIKQNYEDNVYVKSKFLAEQEIFKAISEGTDANIYRVGNLTNRYCDGQHQFNLEDNAFMSRFKFMLQYGVAAKDLFSNKVEFTPIDYCGEIIMKFVTSDRIEKYDSDCVYHIYNHKKVDLERMMGLLDTLGYSIKLLSNDEYRELVLNLSKDINKQKDIQNLMSLGNSSKSQNKQVTIDSMKTQEKLKMLDIDWPTINEEYLEKVIRYMIASGFINLNPVTNV